MYLLLSFAALFAPIIIGGGESIHSSLSRQISFLSNTHILRCIAILMVIMQHVGGFIIGSRIFTPFGGAGVSIFLIVSGYGLALSFKKNELRNYWRKKFFRVFLPWLVVWLIASLLSRENFQWDSGLCKLFLISDSNWYLQYLLFCYLVFWVAHKFIYNYRWIFYAICFAIAFCFMKNIQAEQSLSFILGCLLAENSLFRNSIIKNQKLLLVISIFMAICSLVLKQLPWVRTTMETNIILQHSINLILKLSIGLSVVFGIGYYVKFMNMAITMFVSKISYELYLVHLFVVLGLCEYFDYMFIKLLFFFSCTLLFSCMLYRFDSRVLSKFN